MESDEVIYFEEFYNDEYFKDLKNELGLNKTILSRSGSPTTSEGVFPDFSAEYFPHFFMEPPLLGAPLGKESPKASNLPENIYGLEEVVLESSYGDNNNGDNPEDLVLESSYGDNNEFSFGDNKESSSEDEDGASRPKESTQKKPRTTTKRQDPSESELRWIRPDFWELHHLPNIPLVNYNQKWYKARNQLTDNLNAELKKKQRHNDIFYKIALLIDPPIEYVDRDDDLDWIPPFKNVPAFEYVKPSRPNWFELYSVEQLKGILVQNPPLNKGGHVLAYAYYVFGKYAKVLSLLLQFSKADARNNANSQDFFVYMEKMLCKIHIMSTDNDLPALEEEIKKQFVNWGIEHEKATQSYKLRKLYVPLARANMKKSMLDTIAGAFYIKKAKMTGHEEGDAQEALKTGIEYLLEGITTDKDTKEFIFVERMAWLKRAMMMCGKQLDSNPYNPKINGIIDAMIEHDGGDWSRNNMFEISDQKEESIQSMMRNYNL